MSKFSFDVLQRRVFPFTGGDDPDVLLGASFGEDVALTRVGGDILASHVNPIVGAVSGIGRLAVHVACNDIAASGIPPRWLLLLVLVPGAGDEELLERIMRDAHGAAAEVGASIIGGHTGYSPGITRPLVAVTALGTAGGREPVPPVVTRFAEAFRFDPLRMISSGTLAVTVPPARLDAVRETLERSNTVFAIAGRVAEGSGVHVTEGGTSTHYTELQAEQDELARLWRLYPRDS